MDLWTLWLGLTLNPHGNDVLVAIMDFQGVEQITIDANGPWWFVLSCQLTAEAVCNSRWPGGGSMVSTGSTCQIKEKT